MYDLRQAYWPVAWRVVILEGRRTGSAPCQSWIEVVGSGAECWQASTVWLEIVPVQHRPTSLQCHPAWGQRNQRFANDAELHVCRERASSRISAISESLTQRYERKHPLQPIADDQHYHQDYVCGDCYRWHPYTLLHLLEQGNATDDNALRDKHHNCRPDTNIRVEQCQNGFPECLE